MPKIGVIAVALLALGAVACGDHSDDIVARSPTSLVPVDCPSLPKEFAPAVDVELYATRVEDSVGADGGPMERWAVVSAGGAVFLTPFDPVVTVDGLIMSINLEANLLLGYGDPPRLSIPGETNYQLGDLSVVDDPRIDATIACAQAREASRGTSTGD